MPTYDYLCKDCGYEFEKLQSIISGPLKKCPECGRFGLKRLIGAGSGVIFKGSGFYQTDYRSENYKNDKKAAESSSVKKEPMAKKSDKPSVSEVKADSKANSKN